MLLNNFTITSIRFQPLRIASSVYRDTQQTKFTMKNILILFVLFPVLTFGQYRPQIESYQHKSIIVSNDTIHYHIYSKGKIEEKKKVLIFFHGSGGNPLFRISTRIDSSKVVENGEQKSKAQRIRTVRSSVPFDLDRIPNDYIFVIISKKGVPFSTENENYVPSITFLANESLDYRVWQGDEVIKDITKKLISKPSKVVIIGHSEGSDVVAKLGHINKKVTHVGFWAGGGNTQFYDFALFIQKEVQNGSVTQAEAIESLDSLFTEIKAIENEPNSIEKQWLGNSYRRWARFSEPVIDNLLKIEKPLFVAVGGRDESVPVESSLLIPIEFIRHKKDNLTFKIYPDYNHSFAIAPKNENEGWRSEIMTVFEDFMKWVEQ